MAQAKPWEKYAITPQQGAVVTKLADPARDFAVPLAQERLRGERLANEGRILANQKAEQEVANGGDALIVPESKIHGAQYLRSLSPAIAGQVKGIAEGRIPFPSSFSLKSPYWQAMIQHVVNYDPSFDAVNYNARAATRKDFTSGKSAQNIKALNTAIGHVGQLYDQISGTASHGGFPFATDVNSLVNAYERHKGDSGITNFEQTAGAVASELTQVFRGTGGAEADVQRYLGELNSNASKEQKVEAVRNIVGLLHSRLEAIGDQYLKGMGTTAQPLQLLDQHAQHVLSTITPADGGGGVGGNGGGDVPPSGPGTPPMPSSGGGSLATGATKNGFNQQASDLINAYIRNPEATIEDANQALAPMGFGPIDPRQWAAARAYHKAHPNYPGSFGNAVGPTTPTTFWNRLSAGPVGALATSAANQITLNNLDSLAGLTGVDPANFRAGEQALSAANPVASTIGDIAGALPLAIGAEAAAPALLRRVGADGLVRYAPLLGDAAYGTLSGAGANDQNRLEGAALGGVTGAVGGMFGRALATPIAAAARTRPVSAFVNAGRRAFNLPERVAPAPLSRAETSIMGAANKTGIPDIQAQLDEAQRLGVPMTLADTSPNLRELGAAAVRRSPTASGIAENALVPRGRGQIERFTQAVNRDLGPTANIPQLSADLTQRAQTAAAPLYEQAYAAPGASAVNLSDLIDRPLSMRPGLARAYNIAKEEGRDPTALGFDFTPEGDVALTRVPSFHTLDYVKRGLDDTLEQYRNQLTGKLDLNEATRAINATKNDLLGRIDAVNPAYAAARKAYAGPVQARDALASGRDAFTMTPNDLAFKLSSTSPDLAGQMQLGYRDALMNQANKVRYSSNPFDATLGNPQAEARLRIMHPDNPGVDNLLRQRDLEGQLARSTNDILGNSKTAQRLIADQHFAGEDWPQVALDAGINIATGQVPTSLFLKKGSAQAVKDMFRMGVGKKAVAKADEIAPILFNTDPAQSAASLSDLANNLQVYRDFVAAQKQRLAPRLGMFGAGLGAVSSTGY